nr:hypothetical protein [Tanacetum cinerariifolium]
MQCVTMPAGKPKVLAPGMYAIDVEPIPLTIGTIEEFNKRDKQVANTPLNRKKQVTFKEPCNMSNSNTQTHVKQQRVQKTNVPVIISVGVNSSTKASRTPTEIRDPDYQTLHLHLFSNAGCTDRPLVFGLRLLKTYDEESLSA